MSDHDRNNPRMVKSYDIHLDPEYVRWIYDVKQRFRNAQIKAAVKVNSEQLYFNWQLGGDLVIRIDVHVYCFYITKNTFIYIL